MKELASAYIEARIQKTRSTISDDIAAVLLMEHEVTPADHARRMAGNGFTGVVACFLSQDNILPVREKGEIFAEAFWASASHLMTLKAGLDPETTANVKREIKHTRKVALGLKRAAKRA